MIVFDKDRCPQVLLLGNGLNRVFGGRSWTDLMKQISVRTDLPKELKCPMPLQAVLVTNDHVGKSMKENNKLFYGSVNLELVEQLRTLLVIGFDDILTTNYSYELEAVSQDRAEVTDSFLKKTCKNINDGKRVEPKYLLSSCQTVMCNGVSNRIWHIHGEARKPNSMILGHYYYANLLCQMKNFVDRRSKMYLSYHKKEEPIAMQGWLDSFLLGDVYILGFGIGFSELDLWWLINRKKREDLSAAQIHFYEMKTDGFNEKHELLKLMGVQVHTMDMQCPKKDEQNANDIYKEFYYKAIADIQTKFVNSNGRIA